MYLLIFIILQLFVHRIDSIFRQFQYEKNNI